MINEVRSRCSNWERTIKSVAVRSSRGDGLWHWSIGTGDAVGTERKLKSATARGTFGFPSFLQGRRANVRRGLRPVDGAVPPLARAQSESDIGEIGRLLNEAPEDLPA
jgi:hypothetical protein